HRLLAAVLFIWTLMFLVKVYKNYRNNRVMYYGWIITFSLIFLQVIFGAMIIFTQLNLWIALFHAFFITCYFGMLSYFMLLSNRSAYKEEKATVKQSSSKAIPIKQDAKNEA